MGKMSLIIVVGFNIFFMLMGLNLSSIASHSYNNYTNYYAVEQAQFLAESAANVSIGSLYQNQSWLYGDSAVHNHTMEGGTYSIQAKRSYPNGGAYVTFNIVSTFNGMVDSSTVVCNIPAFSTYAMYTCNDGGNPWSTNDTCFGKLHVDNDLTISGNPYFGGAVTVGGSLQGSGTPTYKAGNPTLGVKLGWVDNFDAVKNIAGYDSIDVGKKTTWKDSKGKTQIYQSDVYVQLMADGTIQIDTGKHISNDSSSLRTTWAAISAKSTHMQSFTVNSMTTKVLGIMGDTSQANLHIRGTLSGQVTIANLGFGNVYIDSSIIYNNKSTDLLGLVAKDTISVTDDPANNTGFVNIQAAVLASTFVVQNQENDTTATMRNANTKGYGKGSQGYLNLFGSLAQKNRGYVGKNVSGTMYGLLKHYTYDNRFSGNGSAPSFPTLPYFQILSWYDRMSWSRSWWDVW